LALRSPPAHVEAGHGITVDRAGGVTVVVLPGPVSPRDAMEALRRAGVRRIDVLRSPRPPTPDLLRALRHRWPVTRTQVVEP
ncbi:MAG: hypothetical protein JWM47_1813, partial [Acidimicrobiales bacterium]|nr:hypothetical protein [Acidimicrobiales bacterium]